MNFVSDLKKMSQLLFFIISLLTIDSSDEVLQSSDNHPHHLVTFQRLSDSQGNVIYKEIDVAETGSPYTREIYTYHPYRNIGAIPGKLRNPQSSHYGHDTRQTPAQLHQVANREERNPSIIELFSEVVQNVAGSLSVLRRSGGGANSVREIMGNIRKSDWISAVVLASSVIGYILYL